MKRATREWVRKAEEDLLGAVTLSAVSDPLHDLVCFHCQQSAEKYLKALLEEGMLPVPKTHDLGKLLDLLAPSHPGLLSLRRGLNTLTMYAVDTRYPLFRATKRKAVAAVRWAGKVRAACRGLLGLPPDG